MAECYGDVEIPAHSYPVADMSIIVEIKEIVSYPDSAIPLLS